MSKTYLLTGGTGFLGSILGVNLIKKGDRIIFLGRSKNGESLDKRLKKTLLLNKIESFEIDLNKRFLGLSEDILKQLSGRVDGLWHLAANLSFRKKDKEKVIATNVDGLKNVLELALYLKAPVYYTSTAYVHGQRSGVIYEKDLVKPKRFNNTYEESKFRAEKLIGKWGEKYGNNFIIFRPSILIERNRKILSFFGYYTVVNSLYKLKKAMKKEPLRLFLPFFYSKDAFLNLMPVDIATDWMMKIVESKQALGKTFHIANPKPFPMEEITKQTFEALNIKMPSMKMPKWFVSFYFSFLYYSSFIIFPLKRLARKFYYYRYYMIEYNSYDMTNTKRFLGKNILNQFNFKKDFIQKIAKDFVRKLEQQ